MCHINLILVFVILYRVGDAEKILLNETNKNSCQELENDYNPKPVACGKTQLFDWCLPHCYNKDIEPWMHLNQTNGSIPFIYDFEFVISSIHEVNDFGGTLVIEMYFIIRWREPRIQIKHHSMEPMNSLKLNEKFFTIPLSNLEILWNPDLDIFGIKEYKSEKVFRNPMASLKLDRNGILRYSIRTIITLSCDMDFQRYPFDSHQCFFRAGSYAYNDKIVKCTSSLRYAHNAKQRNLQYIVTLDDLPHEFQQYIFNDTRWSNCGFTVKLERTKSQMIIQVYLTSISLVIISWISFIVEPSVVPGRMGMLMTVFLVLINILVGVKNTSPTSNGLNSVDIFLVSCLVWVFAALLEYALVLIMNRKWADLNYTKGKSVEKIQDVKDGNHIWSPKFVKKLPSTLNDLQDGPIHNRWDAIDKTSMLFFPVTFLAFLIVYSFKLFQ